MSAAGLPGPEAVELIVRGHALNRMCATFNEESARAAFLADEDSYCARFGLSDEARAAVKSRDKAALIAAGGNMYFFQKLQRIKRGNG